MIAAWFKFKERGTTLSTEVAAGVTTFITMVYIVVVCPAILSKAGMDFNAVFVATILVSIVSTLIMGIAANYPIVIAPGMALVAYFAFGVVVAMEVAWQKALGAVFVASVIFLLLSFTRFRHVLIDAIPFSLKQGITAGIGMFIAFIGMQNAKLIVASPSTLVTMGNLSEPSTLLAAVGLAVTLVLMAYNVRGAIFIGMAAVFALAYFNGLVALPDRLFVFPEGLWHTAMQMDIQGVFDANLYAVVFTFFMITLFDTTGTMLGVAEQAGLMKDGKFLNVKTALLADAVGSTVGAMLGTSPTSAYVESGAGVAAGGRTGFTAVVAAALLGVTLFFAPVAKMLSQTPAITSPALIIVGFLMMNGLRQIDWRDIEEAFPAFMIVFLMPLTYSIATAVGVGFIFYVLLKVMRKKAGEAHPMLYLFAVLFFIQIGFLSH